MSELGPMTPGNRTLRWTLQRWTRFTEGPEAGWRIRWIQLEQYFADNNNNLLVFIMIFKQYFATGWAACALYKPDRSRVQSIDIGRSLSSRLTRPDTTLDIYWPCTGHGTDRTGHSVDPEGQCWTHYWPCRTLGRTYWPGRTYWLDIVLTKPDSNWWLDQAWHNTDRTKAGQWTYWSTRT